MCWPTTGSNVPSTHAEHASQHHLSTDGRVQTPKDGHWHGHGRNIEQKVGDPDEEVQGPFLPTDSGSSGYSIPPVRNGPANKAVCENGTEEEAKIGCENGVADPAESACWEQADIEENDGGTNERDAGDPKEYRHKLALVLCLSE